MNNKDYGYTNFLLQHMRTSHNNNLKTNDIKGTIGL